MVAVAKGSMAFLQNQFRSPNKDVTKTAVGPAAGLAGRTGVQGYLAHKKPPPPPYSRTMRRALWWS
ncbi:hypothetical protein T484DRAFT_3413671 [Baffinella frigidus]|nr:hypothetical protein T484DRAFT_3413671 [Cryptophyta sp. CCMP2293]